MVFPFGFISPQTDPDAKAYIDAVIAAGGTLSDQQKYAINLRIRDMKGMGPYNTSFDYWSILVAWFPYMGGVANSNRINAKSLATGTFAGGWTHNSSGSLSDGAAGTYFDSGINQSTDFTSQSSLTMCESIANNFSANTKALHGLVDGSKGNTLVINDGSNNSYYVLTQTGASGFSSTSIANTIGYWSHRQNGNDLMFDQDGVNVVTVTAAPDTPLNANIYIAANNFTAGPSDTWQTDGQFQSSEFYDGFLTDAQLLKMKQINDLFQSLVR